ncbi:hypothetical protein NQ317_008004 [Molorchus minor]|uniref:THAP-type domain-containing protein n=1 Tax=Molorchus minor TaxID=1323400 RepID=A0ABQ9J722_9CUCU|nr:hypothetical protein NQ317_008004 [Molorchus minor]
MSRFKCAYISCGRSTRKSPGIRTFTFPVKDQVPWDLIALSPDTLRRCFICEKHFKSGDILSKKLSSSAIPIKYDVGSDETKTYGQIANYPTYHLQKETSQRILKKQNLKRKLADTENEVEHLRSKLKKYKNISIVPRDLKGLPYFPRALTTMQLYHKARSPWSIQEKM